MLCGLPDLDQYAKDMKELNFRFVSLCRELARHDRVLACQYFGVSGHFVDRISSASTQDLRDLADNPNLMFRPRNGMGLDVALGAIMAKDVSEQQMRGIRNASMLSDGNAAEAAA